MRLHIRHRTTYRFEAPQARLVQLLRMTPANHHGQTVLAWSLDVDRDARLRSGQDGYGNRVTMLYVDGPLEAIGIEVTGEALTENQAGRIGGIPERLPPATFLQPTALTAPNPALLAFAAGVSLPSDPLEAAHSLNDAVHDRLVAREADAASDQHAAAVLEAGSGDAQGLAHVLIAAARARGTPARYVAGHLYRPGREAASAAHGWAELYARDQGWVGLDPHQGGLAMDRHLRVAIGLDHAQAAPMAGARIGAGDERLDVVVRVAARSD